MNFRAVGNWVAVQPAELALPMSWADALGQLTRQGFRTLDRDVEPIARSCIGMSRYRRGARLSEAPAVVDCSSLTKWVYGQLGIWLPRRSIQQRAEGRSVELDALQAGDLVFIAGSINYYESDPTTGVGHVGLATSDATIIHASSKHQAVIEVPVDQFVTSKNFRGATRIVDDFSQLVTLETPPDREVERSDDIRWIVLQSLS